MRRRSFAVFARVASALALMLVTLPSVVFQAGTASALAASPTVTGPVAGGTPAEFVFSTNFGVAQVGYEESEFFLSGTATSYKPGSPLTTDGKWTVTPNTTAAYTTRAVVRRPINPDEFNGTVIVEWLNVSGGVDAGPDWTLGHNELVRDGFAWVGVSAQSLGVQAAKGNNPAVVPGDPARYAALSHPGDSFSYDIFSQAGRAIRDNSALMLGGLTPDKLIAVGESQSAGRLVTYIDAVHPLVHVYDGFLVHSRGARGAALSQAPQPSALAPTPTLIRGDLDVPVFVFQTETDVFNSNLTARQPDTNLFRTWEVAGSSHFDDYGLVIGPVDIGDGQGAVLNLAAMQNPPSSPSPNFACALPINTGGTHWVLNAAMFWINKWVVNRHVGDEAGDETQDDSVTPPIAQPLQTTGVSPVVFARDANGNVLGGVRSPQVEAPIAALGGVGNSPGFCGLFGTTVPFTASKLATLYPTHGKFVMRWAHAAHQGVEGGFLLREDAEELVDSAASSSIGK